jgi:hypothetical protein
MQNIHSQNQRQVVEAGVMATRRWKLHAFWWISLGQAFYCFIGITYTSWRITPVWFSYSHYRAFVGSIGVSPIGVRIYVYYQCLP